MKVLRRLLILSHRYLGIALSAMAVMWFATGFVMMYAGGMPRLTPEMRLERMPDLDLSRVRLSPADARQRIGESEAAGLQYGSGSGPGRSLLLTVMDRPAYRLDGETVFADTGELLAPLNVSESRVVASRFLRIAEDRVHHAGTVAGDQWTLIPGRGLPYQKFRIDDDLGTEVYVQPRTAEIANLTTTRSRTLAWLGTIPHWLYFAALRANQPLWYRIVVWTSGAVCVLAVLGLALGVIQFRKKRPFRLGAAIPYSGWMRWHYVTGVVFGVFTLTWAFSGLLSMEPFEWTNARGVEVPREALTGGDPDLSRFTALDAGTWSDVLGGRAIREIEFARIHDAHYYVVRQSPLTADVERPRERLHQPYPVTGRVEPDRVLVDARTLDVRREPFSAESLTSRLQAAPRRPGRRVRAAVGLRLVLLLAKPADAAARTPNQAGRSCRDLGLRRPRDESGARGDSAAQPGGTLAVQRPSQPRFRILVHEAAAVGRRHDRAARRRADQRDPGDMDGDHATQTWRARRRPLGESARGTAARCCPSPPDPAESVALVGLPG
jgi:hypothetical protein